MNVKSQRLDKNNCSVWDRGSDSFQETKQEEKFEKDTTYSYTEKQPL